MKKLAFLVFPLVLLSCSKNDEEGSKERTGYLVDSPVENLGYRTATHSGRTDAQGKYLYEEGETVTFFICDLEFPPVPATGYITPFDMAGTTDITNSTVINIATFLQTLDQDGNADNGIFIPEVLHDCSNNIVSPVNFGSSVSAFAANPDVTNSGGEFRVPKYRITRPKCLCGPFAGERLCDSQIFRSIWNSGW